MSASFVVSTSRLGLRPWRLEDAARAEEIYSDPKVHQFFTSPPRDLAGWAAFIAREQLQVPLRGGFGHWALVERATGELVGSCGFRAVEGSRELELGFALAFTRWGRGYTTEIGAACLQHGFEQLGAPRICALTMPLNRAARRVLEKLGMRREADREEDGATWCVYALHAPERPR